MPGDMEPGADSSSRTPFKGLFSTPLERPPRVPPRYGTLAQPQAPSSPFTRQAAASWRLATPEPPSTAPRLTSALVPMVVALLVPTSYIVLHVIYDVLAAKSLAGQIGYSFVDPACMVLFVELLKLMVSLLALSIWSPGEWPCKSRIWATTKSFVPVAVAFAVSNTLMFICLAKVSMASLGVWCQTSIVFNTGMWYIAFRRPFGFQRCVGLVVLTLGCVINSVQPGFSLHFDRNVMWVICSTFFASIGCVLNEYSMKSDIGMSLNIQNSILYTETCFCCLLVVACTSPERLGSPSAFFHGFHEECWAVAGTAVCIGLVVSWILKHASVMTKTFAMAVYCPIEVVLAHWFIGVPLTIFSSMSAVFIVVALLVYFTAPPHEHATKFCSDSHCNEA